MSGIAYAIIAGVLSLIGGIAASSAGRKENYELNEEAANNADTRGRNLYTDLQAPKAQMSQLKEAGLSPSLFYSGNGNLQGISTGAMGAGAAGLANPAMQMHSPTDMAQMRLMEAEANKAQAEADKINGKNERGQEEINNLIADTMGKNAETHYKNIVSIGTELDNKLKESTLEDNINYAHFKAEEMQKTAEKLGWEIISAKALAEVDEATVMPQIQQEFEKVKLLKADVLFHQSSIQLNDAQIDRINNETQIWQQEMLQNWTRLMIEQQNANANTKNAYTQAQYQKAVEKFQDAQIDNLKARLAMDEDHFSRTQRLEYIKIITTLADNGLARGTEIITKLLPSLTKKH